VARKTVEVTIHDDYEVEEMEYFTLDLGKSPLIPLHVRLCEVVSCPIPVPIVDDDASTSPGQVTGVEDFTVKADEVVLKTSWVDP